MGRTRKGAFFAPQRQRPIQRTDNGVVLDQPQFLSRPRFLQPQQRRMRRIVAFFGIAAVAGVSFSRMAVVVVVDASDRFNPYANNDGLCAAVAGRDYVLIATDTRMSAQGYQILERHHVSSRLWTVASVPSTEAASASTDAAPDGSLRIDLRLPHNDDFDPTDPLVLLRDTADVPAALLPDANQHSELSSSSCGDGGVWVASAGCSADCEQLKRSVRSKLRAAMHYGEVPAAITPDQVAVLLSDTLYSRRTFPYYSFCLVAGLSPTTFTGRDGAERNRMSGGQVYAYDAIGSYEQKAAACCGTGFQLMQPILDRRFRAALIPAASSSSLSSAVAAASADDDGDAAAAAMMGMQQQRSGVVHSIPERQVDCTVEEAVEILLDAYRAVAEREIGVGDRVVLYCMERRENDHGRYRTRIWTAPLKKH
jgi:20S proteasome alpha/beta subunit